MKNVSLNLFLAFLMGMFLFTSCKKGDTGPEGPAGAQGANGAQGAQGATGTANVIYSDWLTVKFDSAKNATSKAYYGTILAPKLTAAIVNTGMVKVYVNTGTTAAPEIADVSLIALDVYSSVGNIYMETPFFNLTQPDIWNPSKFRYVLVPGGTAARVANPINWSNYNEVKAYLGLKD